MPNPEVITQRTVNANGSQPIPSGAMSSPFAMARQYLDREQSDAPAADAPDEQEHSTVNETPAPAGPGRGRGPRMTTRAKDTLKACGPLSVEQFAEGLGLDMKTARTLAKNGVQKKFWRREQFPDGEKLVLLTEDGAPVRQSGLKRYLSKKAEKPSPANVKLAGRQPTKKARELPPQVQRNVGVVPAPAARPEEEEAAFGLFSTGEFRIEYGGQEMRLPRKVTKAMVAYLDKIASAFEGE